MLDIKAHFKLQKNRVFGSNFHFTVMVLDDRLLFVRTDSQLNNDAPGTSVSSIVGGAIGMMIDTAGENSHHASSGLEERVKKLNTMIEERILKSDPANIAILMKDIASIKASKTLRSLTPRSGILKIKTTGAREQQYDIPPAEFNNTVELLKRIFRSKLIVM